MEKQPPIVSICCITYNHAPFIRQSIEGMLMQQGVDYEILIHDDCSTDGTTEIVLHSPEDGIFQKLCINESFNGQIIEKDLWVKKGDKVNSFNGANNTIGTLVLKFNNQEDMKEAISHQNEWLEVLVK